MFTVCPKCTLTLVVTTVDLRAGQGYVRCGRCANVFNALVALREGDPSSGTSDSARRRLPELPSKPPVEPAVGAGVAFEPEPEPEPQPQPAPPSAPAAEPAPETEPEVQVEIESRPELESQPEPEPLPETELVPETLLEFSAEAESEAVAEEIVLGDEPPPQGEDISLEFDETATDVSQIFISPEQAEHGTTSGNYEAVVLAVEPQPEQVAEPEPEALDDESHRETIAADDWSLLDDEPPADAESVIEESPFAEAEAEPELESQPESDAEATSEEDLTAEDPAWVQEMFAEAEADVVRSRTAEHRTLEPVTDDDVDEPAVVRAARDVKGVSAASGDTVLEPLLPMPSTAARRPPWQYITGVSVLGVLLVLQLLHANRQSLVLSPTVGPTVSKIYGWFGATPTPNWDLGAYDVQQLGVEAEGADGGRLHVRLSVRNDSDRVQPLPLVRLTLKDRYANAVATRDLEPREYLPPRAADLRLLEPDQRIDADLRVIDPGNAAVGFEIDACLRADNGAVGCANDTRNHAGG